jgi:hypothetical protein
MDRPSAQTGERKRLINRRRQGDLGEASAIEWFTRLGATVWTPLGHSPDADLIAELEGRLLRIQVKTSTCCSQASNGDLRWEIHLATHGGNQSWNGVAKVFDPSRFDVLFALVADGRRWMIPSGAIEGITGITVGGTKYSEFEVDPAAPIEGLIYGDGPPLESGVAAGEYASGQSTGSVKPWTLSSQVRILPPPLPQRESGFKRTKYNRKLGQSGHTRINEKRKVTLPQQAVLEAGLDVGDRLRVSSHGYGRVVLERVGLYSDVPNGS